ncbi:hypothetical protein HanPI659440_Chr16g0621421 [Helianthus annuus]|nr:hypothetical protein HanPI659440_Chr16g0621421 [Helianthus annuus]
MVNHNDRLDAHEQLLQKLQEDLTAQSSRLDSIATTLEADRLENFEFRKAVLAWMKQQEKRIDDCSSGFEFAGTSPRTSTEFDSKVNVKIIGTNHDEIGVLENNRSEEHLDEVIHSSKIELCDILKGSDSPPAYGVEMSTLGWAPTHSLISNSIRVATPAGNSQFGVFVSSPISNSHPSSDRIGSKLLDVQTFGWKPGWDFGWLDYARPLVFASKLFVLDADPKPPDPYTNLKSDLLWKRIHGWCKTARQVAAGMVGSFHLWVVHEQGRPPEDATTTIST